MSSKVAETVFNPLTEDQLKLIDDEVKELQIDVNKEVKDIIQWINEQPHLPNYKGSEKMILNFLHQRKYDMKRCKQTIDNYYSIKNYAPEFFIKRDLHLPTIQNIFPNVDVGYFPKLTPEGYRVIYVVFKTPNVINVIDFFRIFAMISELSLLEDYNRGIVCYSDAGLISFQCLMSYTPFVLRKFAKFFLESYPARLKGIYITHAPSFFGFMHKLVLTILSKKIGQRFHVHTSEDGFEPLLKLLGKENCPIEFGGELCSMDQIREANMNLLEEYREWFIEQGDVRTNESLREKGSNKCQIL